MRPLHSEGAPLRGGGLDRPAVLIVDDVADNLLAFEGMLRRDDVEVLTAQSGRAALDILLERDVAVALIDVQMPDMDGFELATLMRGVQKSRHVPIVFVTAGSAEPSRVFKAYESGAVDYLSKPVDEQILRGKVDVFVTLERQRQQLRHATQARDDVLGVVSHDLGNPVSAIAMCARVLRNSPPEQEDERAQLLETIIRSTELIYRLMSDLIDVANLERGKLSLDRQLEDPSTLVTSAVAMFEVEVSERRLRIATDVEPGLPPLFADGARIVQVLGNLIRNAIKFTLEGGTIVVAVRRADREVRFAVADSGPGVSFDAQPRIFDRYWQAPAGVRKGGRGLGLSIAQGIVNAHGGRIWVESQPGSGATFVFALPIA